MYLPEIASENPRFFERDAPPLSMEFPGGSKIFLLGEHAYGVAAAVSATTETSLSVILLAVRHSVIQCHSALLHSPPYSSSQLKRLRMTSSKPSYRIDDLATISPLSKLQRWLASWGGLWER
jgi:hypothetical protein